MRKNELTELRGLTKEELHDKLYQFKKELFELNFQRRVTRVEKPHKFKATRKMIARIETILKEKGA